MLTTIIVLGVISVVLTLVLLIEYKRNASATNTQAIEKTLQSIVDLQQQSAQQFQQYIMTQFKDNRLETQQTMSTLQTGLMKQINDHAQLQKNQLDLVTKNINILTKNNEDRLTAVRETVEKRITALQEDNNKKLEQMRATVDEKLQSTLEKRLGQSFKLVSDRLENVYKGLGEMKQLANGVGDLKKVLTNVKTRGTWGEVQCGNLLEQILTKEQFDSQVAILPNKQDRVDFAIKLPGKNEQPVYLPIDSKFPLESYQLLLDAQDRGDLEQITLHSKALEKQILLEAKRIKEKYLCPPHTTDFAILYVPIEGLYAEMLRHPDIQEQLQVKYRIIMSGPNTLAALLNSLQMGFKTLAIEQRSSEVWTILAAVKQEFIKFGDILDKTQKKLQEAGNTIETASRKSRTIERKLRNVESLPEQQDVQPVSASMLF